MAATGDQNGPEIPNFEIDTVQETHAGLFELPHTGYVVMSPASIQLALQPLVVLNKLHMDLYNSCAFGSDWHKSTALKITNKSPGWLKYVRRGRPRSPFLCTSHHGLKATDLEC